MLTGMNTAILYNTKLLFLQGTWDLPVQLRKEAAAKGISLAPWWMRFYDLRIVYRWWRRQMGV